MPRLLSCKYGLCTSKQNSTNRQVNGAPGVYFVKFPSAKKDTEKCLRWVKACGREEFTLANVSRGTYICSRHFYSLSGPTDENPDPIPLATLLDPNFSFQNQIYQKDRITKPEEIRENVVDITTKPLEVRGKVDDKTAKPPEVQETMDQGVEENQPASPESNTLDFKGLLPPIGWSMEILSDGVVFTKNRNHEVVLFCEVLKNNTISEVNDDPVSMTIIALGKKISNDKIDKTLKIECNLDIYNLLKKLDYFKICPGNNDEDLVKLYRERRPNNHKVNSNYSENLKSVYSNRCEGLIEVLGKRCVSCRLYRSTLRTLRLRSKVVTKHCNAKAKSSKPNKKLKKQLPLSENVKKELSGLKRLFKEKMKKEKPGSFMSIFIKQQLRALERSKYGMRWDSVFLKWCSYMKNKSKSAYETLKKSGIITLPTIRTLYNHEHTTQNKSGFNEDVFNELVDVTDIDNLPEHKKYFVLLLDEMSNKPDLNCHKDTGYLTGFTDIDDYHNFLNDKEEELKGTTTPPLATSILQLMIRGITSNIRIPFAHFPTTGATSGELYSIIWEAISLLENHGFRILAVVGDGASTNRKVFRMCANDEGEATVPFVTCNVHAADEERNIFFLSDAPHLIKTVRNCFSNSGAHSLSRDLWRNGEEISWKVILRLYYSQLRMKGQFKNASKLTYSHVFLNGYSKMKVNLATQVMSETVASAIETLFGNDRYHETLKFIRTFDKFFDLCNVKNCTEGFRKRKPNKKVYETEDDERLKWLEEDFIKYLDDWEKDVASRPGDFSKTDRSRMLLSATTIEGLRMTALSTVEIVKYLLKKGAKYVLTQHLNQDPLEQYFGRQRCSGGRNSNPSVALFEANMDKLKALSGLVIEAVKGNTTISEKMVM